MIRPRTFHRAGWTLIELMVSATIAIIIVLAVSLVFNKAAKTISNGRAAIELSGNLRSAAHQLREDLHGVTCPTLPIVDEAVGVGYFEYVEGPARDWDADADGIADVLQPDADTTLGDIDDILIFTARAKDKPFRGYIWGEPVRNLDGTTTYVRANIPPDSWPLNVIESQYAEIVWWTRWDDENGDGVREANEVTLCRRHFLIRPDIESDRGQSNVAVWGNRGSSLGDLAMPTNRLDGFFYSGQSVSPIILWHFGHVLNHPPEPQGQFLSWDPRYSLLGAPPHVVPRPAGEIVVLTNVLAFDVKGYDPLVPVKSSNGRALVPADPGYAAAPASSIVGRGAFVDLNYAGDSTISWFSGPPDIRSGLWRNSVVAFPWGQGGPGIPEPPRAAWSTYPTLYERDGLKQDMADGAIPELTALPPDASTNGIDDDGINGVDDAGEWETAPPYNHALRGIEITIRALEPDSHQVRQTTVRISFVPE